MTSFTYGGTALSSFGTVTVMNSYLNFANRRGDNQVIPFRDGAVHVNKFFDQRILTFGITIQKSSAANLESSLDDLRKLFSPRTTQTLAMTLESAAVRNISATVDREMEVERFGPYIAKVVVEFVCAKPVWRLSSAITDNTTTIDASPKAMTVTNPGTVQERDATIILTGPLQNTVITNSTNGLTLTYTGTIASPRVVTISTSATGEYLATTDLAANVIGNVTHTGDACLMAFNPGDNTMSITDATATTGTVKVTFNAPYL